MARWGFIIRRFLVKRRIEQIEQIDQKTETCLPSFSRTVLLLHRFATSPTNLKHPANTVLNLWRMATIIRAHDRLMFADCLVNFWRHVDCAPIALAPNLSVHINRVRITFNRPH